LKLIEIDSAGGFFAGAEPIETNDGKLKIKPDGEYNILFYGAAVYGNQSPLTGSGDLVTINLKAVDIGSTKLELSDVYVGDYKADRIYVDIENGEVTVEIPGDVNDDGVVDTKDATEILRHVVGLSPVKQFIERRADVSGNGEVTAYDAALIMQKVDGLIEGF